MRLAVGPREMHMRGCQPSPCASEIWINLSRSLEHLSSQSYVLARPFLEQLPSAQIEFVRFDAGRGALG